MIEIDSKLFASTFSLVFLAELPDKTAFATLLLATRRNPFAIFIGVAAAFMFQSAVAVLFGGLFALLPHVWVKVGSALLFFIFAYLMWKRKEEEHHAPENELSFLNTVWSSFVVIFIAEWGDITQLATATLSAQYHDRFTIFISSTLALWCVTIIAIVIGHRAKGSINPAVLKTIAVVAFVAVGVWTLLSLIIEH